MPTSAGLQQGPNLRERRLALEKQQAALKEKKIKRELEILSLLNLKLNKEKPLKDFSHRWEIEALIEKAQRLRKRDFYDLGIPISTFKKIERKFLGHSSSPIRIISRESNHANSDLFDHYGIMS